ncbi:MAG: hypothetical protein H6662_01535 [Ardenticatenaceae bacterium]|nr:hypothetical protein [Anaerolineales bacterium]MCB8920239.1 hypothetical protein [Ardenticatenaceae bacterium]MCB8991972.1 hypothetical protein [Ardenticatenaceae bacterium]MCB9004911.1 hypothetical protein [Ardenticatenaceae bacterium]
MELSDYLRILRQRGWVVLVMAVLTAVAAFGFSKMQTEIYESNLKLLVHPARNDYGQSQASRELLGSFEQRLNSSYYAADVINILQLDMTPQQLLGDFTVSSDRLTLVLQLAVENTDPDLANDIARSWGDLLIQWQDQENEKNRQEDRITIERQDEPRASLVQPKTTINTAAGGVFGVILGLIAIFILEWIESGVVRRSEDIERYLDIPVIGSIPTDS